ncbi:hypothetical protein B0181_09935 [Moraxella caviae]|uniref:Uncharacterized protein n=1 Tax=Moraxella caviae TaxID=34060 RepID=A0A1S9ZVX0_9GAMM|nr:hypothetical protein [Moraxella caviae]OOR87676.1 hypothetical protein B0181_09935 [Moraxella caviae]STZ14484.1 Uncharacterised protein [Moraxella caviae]
MKHQIIGLCPNSDHDVDFERKTADVYLQYAQGGDDPPNILVRAHFTHDTYWHGGMDYHTTEVQEFSFFEVTGYTVIEMFDGDEYVSPAGHEFVGVEAIINEYLNEQDFSMFAAERKKRA